MQSRNRDTGLENKCRDTNGGREGGMNWEIGIDIYALLCIKKTSSTTTILRAQGTLLNILQYPKREKNPKYYGYSYIYNCIKLL